MAAATPKAKNRLTSMVVQEVSLVDRAANQEVFLLLKRDNMATNVMKLKLPKAAKTSLMEGLAKVLDQVTGLATVIGDSEEDDTAAVPDDVYATLKGCSDHLATLANAGNGAAPPLDAPPSDGAETEPPNQVTASAAPGTAPPATAPGALPGSAPLAVASPPLDAAQKGGLPSEQRDSTNIAQPMREGDNLQSELRKCIALAHVELASYEKAGRKIAAARYGKLRELHDNLGKLLNELAYDQANEANDPTGKADLQKAVNAANAAVASLALRLDAQEGKTPVSTAKTEGTSPLVKSNGAPVEGAGAPQNGTRVIWPRDMSADRKQKKQTAAAR
jgi:hypothetical protein